MGDVELLLWSDRLVHVLNPPTFTLSVEGTHVVEEDAALIR